MFTDHKALLPRGAFLILACLMTSACSPAESIGPSLTPRQSPISSPAKPSTLTPTARASATASHTPNPTSAPPISPSPTPSRTPFAPGQCPQTSQPAPTLTPNELQAPSWQIEFYEEQLLSYLNTVGSAAALGDNLNRRQYVDGAKVRAHVQTTDLTGDGFPEVLVSLISFEGSPGAAIPVVFVFDCDDYSFHTLFRDYYGGETPGFREGDGLRALRDLNGDGIRDVLLSAILVSGTGGDYHRVFRILEWDGSTFRDLIPLIPCCGATAATSENADHAIRDTDGDGILELILTQSIPPWDGVPVRVRTDTWAWGGTEYSLRSWEHTPPLFRYQAVQDGDDASRFGEYDRAIRSYQQAIFDEKLLGWTTGFFYDPLNPTPPPTNLDERPRLEAYSRYRILLIHVVESRLDEAEIVYSTLQQKFPVGSLGFPYAAMATAFWEAYQAGAGITQACASAISYAQDHESEVLSWPLYIFDNEPADLCPFHDG